MNVKEIYKKVRPSIIGLATMPIEGPKGTGSTYSFFGSGFCIDSSGIFVTAKHCVMAEGQTKINEVDFHIVRTWFNANEGGWNLFTLKPRAVVVSMDHDLALLYSPTTDPAFFPAMSYSTGFDITEGQEVAAIGFPFTSNNYAVYPNVFHGVVSRIDYRFKEQKVKVDNIVLDMSLHIGNSGGPVIDENGNAIAVVSSQELRETLKAGGIKDEWAKLTWTNLINCVPSFNLLGMMDQFKAIIKKKMAEEASKRVI